jgi:hypothetical protein
VNRKVRGRTTTSNADECMDDSNRRKVHTRDCKPGGHTALKRRGPETAPKREGAGLSVAMIVVMIFMIMVVVIMIVVTVMIAIALMVIVVIMMMAMPVVVLVVVMFVRVPVSPAGWIIPVIVTVALVVTIVCRGSSRAERQTAETNHGRSSEGDYRLTGHAGFLQMCNEERTFC